MALVTLFRGKKVPSGGRGPGRPEGSHDLLTFLPRRCLLTAPEQEVCPRVSTKNQEVKSKWCLYHSLKEGLRECRTLMLPSKLVSPFWILLNLHENIEILAQSNVKHRQLVFEVVSEENMHCNLPFCVLYLSVYTCNRCAYYDFLRLVLILVLKYVYTYLFVCVVISKLLQDRRLIL